MQSLKIRIFTATFIVFAVACTAHANPNPDQTKVPPNSAFKFSGEVDANSESIRKIGKSVSNADAIKVLRIQFDWNESTESYSLVEAVIEPSGTEALVRRAAKRPKWGSYLGILKDLETKSEIAYDSVGTGIEYRKLVRAVTFRFPLPQKPAVVELNAENPKSGKMEKVLEVTVQPETLKEKSFVSSNLEVRELALAPERPAVRVVFYADGYLAARKDVFFGDSKRAMDVLVKNSFPGANKMDFYAVFNPSTVTLGNPRKLDMPVPEYNSFLGLFYAYWWKGGNRWYNVTYPTREQKFREALASFAYDYPIALIDNDEYWGMGTYMGLTAVPARNKEYFNYLLVHEFGHFFGLNEEYSSDGTELKFAPDMAKSWSQNLTFLKDGNIKDLKWKPFVNAETPIPTPKSFWNNHNYGAYEGGYGGEHSSGGHNHIPGLSCVMGTFNPDFCKICRHAIEEVVDFGR